MMTYFDICRHSCECKPGYEGSGETGDCRDVCEGRCRNQVRIITEILIGRNKFLSVGKMLER